MTKMALIRPEAKISVVIGLALLFCGANAHRLGLINHNIAVFDVTKFGAKTGGKYDCNTAITRAWVAACNAHGPAKVVIPPGDYMAGEVFFSGPCSHHVTVEVQGTITANKDPSEFANNGWFQVENVDGITINGDNFKGSFHGSGETTWKYDTCKSNCEGPPSIPNFYFNNVKHADVGFLSSIDSRGYHFTVFESSDVKLHNLNIHAPSNSPHTNALNAISSHNVGLIDSTVNTGGGKDCVVWGPGDTNTFYSSVACNLHH